MNCKKHLIIERWKKCQHYALKFSKNYEKVLNKMICDLIVPTFNMRPLLNMENTVKDRSFAFVYKLTKNI